MSAASIPKGTRDFGPDQMNKRNYIFDIIKGVFRTYGYQPIETPSMEHLSTLMGKYGEEGDKLLFKILNSGDFMRKVNETDLNERNIAKLAAQLCDRGLRYDLTVPFARYVVQHRNDISFPFKRYQIQPVWRADRPQKGRYREFYQCDVDVIGSNSLLNEAELIQIVEEVFTALDIAVVTKLNNRKVLAGIAEFIGEKTQLIPITDAIDKLDKIGLEGVNHELLAKGIAQESIDKLQPILHLKGTTQEKLTTLKELLADSEIGKQGIEEVETMFHYIEVLGVTMEVELDLTLARGLNYYTGAIFEVKAKEVAIGSITGGGRYDDLTGIFGLKNVSGVGISFGAERIYDVMEAQNLFPATATTSTQVLFLNFGNQEVNYVLKIAKTLREKGVCVEVYPDSVKMKKQMIYANQRQIPSVVMAGEREIAEGKVTLKNMTTGDQVEVDADALFEAL